MWLQVDRTRAQASPCYGIKGSLAVVLWLIVAVGLFGVWRSVIPLVHLLTREIPETDYLFGLVALLCLRLGLSAWLVQVAFAGLAGAPAFPRRATLAILALFLVHGALVALFIMLRRDDAIMLRRVLPELSATLALAVVALVWLRVSRRVNATFRHRLRPGDRGSAAAMPEDISGHSIA